jgi:non-reducing end alpha-L-arabinofuranosidase
MRTQYLLYSAVALVVIPAACSEDSSTPPGGTGGAATATGGNKPTGGSVSNPTGGSSVGGIANPTGGMPSNGGTSTGGVTNPAGGNATGGVTTPAGGSGGATGGMAPMGGKSAGEGGTTAGSAGGAGAPATGGASGGGSNNAMGPCDIYEAATPSTPCVGAYSTIRRLRAAYTGPLFQVRSGSNAMNTGTGGETHDIAQDADGFALMSAVTAACGSGTCTVSLLYDQSGKGNNLPVAKRGGNENGGPWADEDDFETVVNSKGQLSVGGRTVWSLYMAERQGYRMTKAGNGVPKGNQAPQGIYMLADGTHAGTTCCWDFGNVTPDPTTYHDMNTLFFGKAFWGSGEGGPMDGYPWFMADFEAGVWAGGSKPGDPGWGALEGAHPPNPNNPAMKGVKFALGFLKTNATDWALRAADTTKDSAIKTAYKGALPKVIANEGAIVLGVGGDNSNNSWGTFYEGAVLSGFPSDDAELAVLQNIKAVGYGK